ncbi:MAG: CCA tRNA nucleotidyltransferase [Acidobacteriota bacterium]|nr:CCA tRNA nucleotidyltransferase [Acidobacteriota bacterium]
MSPEELARASIAKLRAEGWAAYLVGGCVRDTLLGREPKDFDVATAAPPNEVQRIFPRARQVGAQFGVMLLREDDAQVEIATFRRDHEYLDGRRPTRVSFEQDPKQDVLRRDFTVNALLMEPESGQITDLVNGLEDLRGRVIRAIGNPAERFREDHLRLLRAVRFAARLNFEIEPVTFEAIRQNRSLIRGVSAERIRDELSRILTEGAPRRGFELLDEAGLLQEILPEIAAMKGVEQPAEFHPEGDVWTHTLLMLEGLDHPSVTLALGILLHDVGKPGTFRAAPDRIRFDGHVEEGMRLARGILARLRYSNDESEQVLSLIENHMKFKDVPRMRESTIKRFLRMPWFDEHLALHRLDCLSSHGSLENYDFVVRKREETPPEQLKPKPLITGKDLIAAGYQPGPGFSSALKAVEEAQLEGQIQSAEEAMGIAMRVLGS